MQTAPVQNKRDIEAILASAGLRPDKHLGQHFLIDGNLMRKLVTSAEIAPGDVVLEVGGGTGGLTDLLAALATRVVVVEVDHDLAPLLRQRFEENPNVTVLHTDVLANKSTIAPVVLETLQSAMSGGNRCVLVANLPYHVATPLIMNLLTARPQAQRMCFTIQREVADRIFAQSGSRDFGPLAIAVQTTCTLQRLARIPPQAFWPPPKVESSMIRLDLKPHPFESGGRLERFIKLVRAAFTHRRKTLRYNLARHLDVDAVTKALELVDGNQRAERVGLADWIALGERLL